MFRKLYIRIMINLSIWFMEAAGYKVNDLKIENKFEVDGKVH